MGTTIGGRIFSAKIFWPVTSAIVSGIILAAGGFAIGLQNSVSTEKVLREKTEEFQNKMIAVYSESTKQVRDQYNDSIKQVQNQAAAFADIRDQVGRIQGETQAVAKQAQSAAEATEAARIRTETATQRASALVSQSSADVAKAILDSPESRTILARAADSQVESLTELVRSNQEKLQSAQRELQNVISSLEWKAASSEGFKIDCQYRIRMKNWLNESPDKADDLVAFATKITVFSASFVFIGGDKDRTTINLFVLRDRKTISFEVGGPGNGSVRPVTLEERCPPARL